jgi:hypothetical protein
MGQNVDDAHYFKTDIARRKMCLNRNKRVRASAFSTSLNQSSIPLVLLLILRSTTCCRAWSTNTAFCWRTSTAFGRKTTVPFLSSLDDSRPEDEDMDMPDPREMQQSMNDLFSIKKKEPINQDPAGGYTLTDLEDYFSQRTPGSKSPARPTPKLNATLEKSFPAAGADGMYLDPDLYVKSSQWLNADGSLNFPDDEERLKPARTGRDYQRVLKAIVQPAPNSPDSVAPSVGGIQDMEDVWQAMQQQQASTTTTNNPQQTTTTSEELHRQVFAEEQGYLQQSQIFREALTDSTKAAEAATLRHGQQFRQRQEEAIASLDEQIKEWEEGWEENYAQAQHCSKCECILAHDEIAMSRKHQGLCQVCYGEVLVAKSKRNSPPSPPVPRQPVLRRLETGGTFRPRPKKPTVIDAETVQDTEPNKEMGPVESFRRDRAPENLAPEQPTGPPSERVERTARSSRSPPVSREPTKPPRNWPQRPTRPTRPPDPLDRERQRQKDSNENSSASPPAKQPDVGQPPLPFFAAKTVAPPQSKGTNE